MRILNNSKSAINQALTSIEIFYNTIEKIGGFGYEYYRLIKEYGH